MATPKWSLLLPLCFVALLLSGIVIVHTMVSRPIMRTGSPASTMSMSASMLPTAGPSPTGCNPLPPVGSPIPDTHALPPIKNYDPCTHRFTMAENALKHTGGPYISQAQAEKIAIGQTKPIRIQSYFVTYAQYQQMMGHTNISSTIYPDREVWLVVFQLTDRTGLGPIHVQPGMVPPTPPPLFYVFCMIDATTGQVLEMGEGGTTPWPPSLPQS